MKRVLILLITVIGLEAKSIDAIEYEGLIHLSEETAGEITKIEVGEELDIEKINKAIKELYEYNYFKDIVASYDQGTLTFSFKEKPIISKVDIIGYKEAEQENILDALGIDKGDIYDEQKMQEAKKDILDLLEYEGFFDSDISLETTEEGNSVELDIVVKKGEQVHIKSLEFMGNTVFDDGDLENILKNREQEFLGWMWGRNDGLIHVNEIPIDKQRLKDYYMQHGYLDVAISDGLLEVDFGGYKAKQLYKIEEGEPYTVSTVTIKQEKQVLELDTVELELEEGETFNIEEFRTDSKTLNDAVADKGYAYVRVTPDIIPNSEEHTVEVVYTIEPGDKVYINDVIISGNTRTIDRVVRREVFLAPGDLFSLTDLEDSRKALKRTGYFEKVEIKQKRVAIDEMNLEVEVKEQPTGNIIVGAGYGSYDGFLYNVAVSDKNIFGSGLDVGVDVEKSDKTSTYNIHVNNPRVWDSEYSTGVNVFKDSYEAYEYDETTQGGSVFVGKKLSRHLTGTLKLLYVDVDLDYDDVNLVDEKYDKSSIIPSLTYDTTDSYYLPREGIAASTSLEYAGMYGKEEFVKSYSKFSMYYGLEDLIDYDMILRYKAKLGYINDRGYLHINEKLYMGGTGTVRGYSTNSISPRDAQYDRIGGKKMFANSIEASIPLVESAKMRLAFFLDYGMIGEGSFNEIKRAGTGAVIEWLAPLGPIQFIFAQALDDEFVDDTTSFEFTMGKRF